MTRTSSLPPDVRELLRQARLAARHAYAPYSKFRVGAALRTRRGAVFTGCNVENASYGLTVCAERHAIAAAVRAEGAKMRIAAFACVVLAAEAFPPCGACRQVMSEFAGDETLVIYASDKSAPVQVRLGELLPAAFRLTGAV